MGYALYAHARSLARKRLASCARERPDVNALRRRLPKELEMVQTTTTTSLELTVDDLFGCNGGSLELGENGDYILKCPRDAKQHANSWWSTQMSDGMPPRKLGQKPIGADCWKSGFSWVTCCAPSFGPDGNIDCWDAKFNYRRCCT